MYYYAEVCFRNNKHRTEDFLIISEFCTNEYFKHVYGSVLFAQVRNIISMFIISEDSYAKKKNHHIFKADLSNLANTIKSVYYVHLI